MLTLVYKIVALKNVIGSYDDRDHRDGYHLNSSASHVLVDTKRWGEGVPFISKMFLAQKSTFFVYSKICTETSQ